MDQNDLKKIAASAIIGSAMLAANMASADPSKFYDANGNEVARTKCEIYTRVMGYYRPVSQFNNGKKSEFYTRAYFDECQSANSEFIKDFEEKNEDGKTE